MFQRLLSQPFVPQSLVYLAPDLTQHWYRIVRCLDGKIQLKPTTKTGKHPVLVLDPAVPYRRRYPLVLDKRFHRNALMAAVDGMFPFQTDEGYFAIGEEADNGYLYGIPQQQLDEMLTQEIPQPRAVLVSTAHIDALHLALNRWIQRGSISDLLNNPRPINPALRSTSLLLVMTTLLLSGLWFNWNQQQAEQTEQFQARYSKLQTEGERLLTRYHAIKNMEAALLGLQELALMPASTAQAQMDMLMRTLPENTAIDRISYQNGRLKISGWGVDPKQWLDLETGSFRLLEYNALLNDIGRFQLESIEAKAKAPIPHHEDQ